MSNTAQEIYSQVFCNLSPTEQLRLAKLILISKTNTTEAKLGSLGLVVALGNQ
jgi:hypothetical protein